MPKPQGGKPKKKASAPGFVNMGAVRREVQSARRPDVLKYPEVPLQLDGKYQACCWSRWDPAMYVPTCPCSECHRRRLLDKFEPKVLFLEEPLELEDQSQGTREDVDPKVGFGAPWAANLPQVEYGATMAANSEEKTQEVGAPLAASSTSPRSQDEDEEFGPGLLCNSEEYRFRGHIKKQVLERWKEIEEDSVIDGFASQQNCNFKTWWGARSPFASDAWWQSWSFPPVLWMNPPFSKLQKFTRKVKSDGAHVIATIPGWYSRPCFKEAAEMALEEMVFEKGTGVFELFGRACKPTRWATHVKLLCGHSPKCAIQNFFRSQNPETEVRPLIRRTNAAKRRFRRQQLQLKLAETQRLKQDGLTPCPSNVAINPVEAQTKAKPKKKDVGALTLVDS